MTRGAYRSIPEARNGDWVALAAPQLDLAEDFRYRRRSVALNKPLR